MLRLSSEEYACLLEQQDGQSGKRARAEYVHVGAVSPI